MQVSVLERRVSAHPLRMARVALGVSQRDLERAAGLPATSVSHIEARRRVPTPAVRERLAMALDVDVDKLFPAHTLVTGGER